MLASPFTKLLNDLRRRVAGSSASSDGACLRRFAEENCQDSFTALVQRHGPLVWGVCLRTLRNEADAEDAFQAAFLVLARKAASLVGSDSVASWLYGVAFRVSSQARRSKARRLKHERGLQQMVTSQAPGPDLCDVLDEELSRMPEKYRMPLVLCHLHGHSREEAARELGTTPVQVKGNLERGREMLRRRLESRGLAITAGLLAAALAETTAGMPPRLVALTVKVVAGNASDDVLALAKGALSTMFWSRIKTASAVLFLIGLIGSTALLVERSVAFVPIPEQPVAIPEKPKPVIQNGLAVTVQAAKKVFAENEPLDFAVTFTNVSDKPFMLFDAGYIWSWRHLFDGTKRWPLGAAPFESERWRLRQLFDDKRAYAPSVALEPGASTTTTVRLEPTPLRFDFVPVDPRAERRELWPDGPPRAALPPDRYAYKVIIILNEDIRNRKYAHAHWTGQIAANPVAFEIAAQKPAE